MSEQYERFITTVQQKASTNGEAAERAAQATLQTLAERLSQGEARDLPAQLPGPLAGWLFTDTDAAAFGLEEFLRRDVGTAERYAHAVFTVLGRTADRGEIADMAAELPQAFAPLVADAENRFFGAVTLEALLRGVADRAGLFPDGARKATEAVLETLAERNAAGEVDDLIELLPLELHAPLQRGKQRGNGKAVRMSLDDFARRVAEREDTSLEAARDVTAQLPRDYEALAN
jgi:uncharacterized protein (DUF2267 family)